MLLGALGERAEKSKRELNFKSHAGGYPVRGKKKYNVMWLRRDWFPGRETVITKAL